MSEVAPPVGSSTTAGSPLSPASRARDLPPQLPEAGWSADASPATLSTVSDLLISRAQALGGVLATADAAPLGLRSRDVAGLVREGSLTRVGPRAHVLTEVLSAARTPEQVHRLTAMALTQSFGGRVAASHHSALAMYGLPFWRVPSHWFHVARVEGHGSRRRGSLSIHEAYPAGTGGFDAITTSPASGLKAVSVALALIGTAMVDGEEAGIVATDAALHRGLVTRAELGAWLERLHRRPGLGSARRAVALADARSESVGETRTRLLLAAMPDLPEITPQFAFVDPAGSEWARADFLVGARLVVEFDGRTKYKASEGSTTTEIEDVVWREKRREDRIRAHGGGMVVVRLVWDDLDHPDRARAVIRQGLAHVAHLPVVA